MTTTIFSSILPGNGPAFSDEEEISDSYREDTTDGDGENTE